MSKEKSKETRTKTWTLVVYPDSAPSDWRDRLDNLHIEWVESPLHDKDVNANGELKKPHWHILLIFGGVKSYDQVLEICNLVSAPIPERCHNARALVRYMVHMDNPDKAQYSRSDIVSHGGADVSELLRSNSSERHDIISEMVEFIIENEIIEFMDLFNYARLYQRDRWFPLLCDNSAYVINLAIKSQRHRDKKES